MIRRAIIVVLTLLAMTTVVVWGTSYLKPLAVERSLTSELLVGVLADVGQVGGWVLDSESDSRSRFFRKSCISIMQSQIYAGARKVFEKGFLRENSFRRPMLTGVRLSTLACPLWVPALGFTVYPTIAFIRSPARRWRRRKRGECVRCGNDLTGNDSGVCPECGKQIGTPDHGDR